MNAPIIKIELEGMKQCMMHAFSEQLLNMDKAFQVAIEDACRPEKVQALMTDAANRYIAEAVQSETKAFFLYGEGRRLIAAKVLETLRQEEGAA